MGYEINLMIGKLGLRGPEYERDTDGLYIKDDHNNLTPTGRTESYFMQYASLDLCKPGYDSHIFNIASTNPDPKEVVYWYVGDTRITTDRYGEELRPVPILEVLEALQEDDQEYRRFRWAVALLESMVDDSEEIHVLLYGH